MSIYKKKDVPGIRVNTSDRLRRLRLRMKASNYDAYIVPSSDEHEVIVFVLVLNIFNYFLLYCS